MRKFVICLSLLFIPVVRGEVATIEAAQALNIGAVAVSADGKNLCLLSDSDIYCSYDYGKTLRKVFVLKDEEPAAAVYAVRDGVFYAATSRRVIRLGPEPEVVLRAGDESRINDIGFFDGILYAAAQDGLYAARSRAKGFKKIKPFRGAAVYWLKPGMGRMLAGAGDGVALGIGASAGALALALAAAGVGIFGLQQYGVANDVTVPAKDAFAAYDTAVVTGWLARSWLEHLYVVRTAANAIALRNDPAPYDSPTSLELERALLGDPHDGLVLGEPQRRLVRAHVDRDLEVTVPEHLGVVIVEEADDLLRVDPRRQPDVGVAGVLEVIEHADLEVVRGR